MAKHVVMLSFTHPVNVNLVCLRCKQDLEYEGQLEEAWHLDPVKYSCNCPDNEFWYLQLRDTTGE